MTADRPRPAAKRTGRGAAAVPWLLFALALALRLVRLGHEPLWFDEAYTALQASKPVGEILALLREEAGAPLYYLWLHVWTGWFGNGEWVLRLPSALAGAAAVPLLQRLGSTMMSPRAGWIAGAMAVVSPLQVHYSQEARMYALVALLGLAALGLTYRVATAPTVRDALLLGVTLLAGLYLHYYFLFFLPVLAIALRTGERRRAAPFLAGASAVAVVGFAPWIPTLFHQTANPSTAWIADFWRDHSLGYALPWSMECLGPGALYPNWQALKLASSLPLRVVSLSLGALAVAAAIRESHRARVDRRARGTALTLGAFLIPLVLACGLSLVRTPIHVVARYDLLVWGPYLLLVAAVLARLRPVLAIGLTAVWIGLSAFTLAPHFTTTREVRNYSDLGPVYAERLAAITRPGELVIFTAGTRTTTDYYLAREAVELNRVSFPLGNDDHLGWVHARVYTDADFATSEARRLVAAHVDTPEPPAVIWISAPKSRGTDALLRELARRGFAPDRARSVTSLLCLTHAGGPTPDAGRS